MEFRYEYDGDLYTVQLEQQANGRYKAYIDDRDYEVDVRRLPTGQINLVINGQTLRTFYESDNNKTHFVALRQGNTQHYTFKTALTSNTRKRAAASAGHIEAQMPGQVIELHVQEGDHVTEGQTLLILEAMKMEIRVSAPTSGVVQKLFASQGSTVERGQQLVDIAPI